MITEKRTELFKALANAVERLKIAVETMNAPRKVVRDAGNRVVALEIDNGSHENI